MMSQDGETAGQKYIQMEGYGMMSQDGETARQKYIQMEGYGMIEQGWRD